MLLFRINTYSNNANITYGIDVIDKERTVRQYANLSDNAEEIKKLVILCNSLDIEECHIDDIVEDFLTDFKHINIAIFLQMCYTYIITY